MILILADAHSERLKYTLDFIFRQRGLDYEVTTSQLEFESADVSYRLNYSERNSAYSKQIRPSTLLRETTIRDQKIDEKEFEGEPCLTFDNVCDPLAAIFYILSRYEEYREQEKDEHQRFTASRSILFRFGWQQKVVCDRWAKSVIEFIFKELYLDVELSMRLMNPVRFIPTFDIDNAYAFKHKAIGRQMLSLGRDLIKGNLFKVKQRLSVWNGGEDPYDTYDTMISVLNKFEHSRVFWLVASEGTNDRNIAIDQPAVQALIERLKSTTKVGLHPGYNSFNDLKVLLSEKKKLEVALDHPVVDSRFHFLRFNLPISFRQLIDAGIQTDYSMGFAETVGFRMGTARQVTWFDLERNEETKLLLQPFCYMDGTLNEYMHLTTEESITLVKELYKEIRMFGGDFCFIWHNETISNSGSWKGWKEVLDETLNLNNE
jgi:hypothetical protein